MPSSQELFLSAQQLLGIDYQVHKDVFTFTNKPAVAVGALPVKEVVDAFEQVYPKGGSELSVVTIPFLFDTPKQTLGISDAQKEEWHGPIADTLQVLAAQTSTLLTPFLGIVGVEKVYLSITDEIAKPEHDKGNEIAHIDTISLTAQELLLLKGYPRSTWTLKQGEFTGRHIESIFINGDLSLKHSKAVRVSDWTSREDQAVLLSTNGTVHPRVGRPNYVTYRYRGLLRAELRQLQQTGVPEQTKRAQPLPA